MMIMYDDRMWRCLFCTRHRRLGSTPRAQLAKTCLYTGNAIVFREGRVVLAACRACHKIHPKKNKGLSYSIREGIGKKLKYRQKPYKMKG